MHGILLWREISLSRSQAIMHYRTLFWTGFLSTIVELVILTSNFGYSFHWNYSHNSMHISTACICIVLLLTLVIVSRNRLVFVSDLEEQSSRIASRSVNYGTLNPELMPLISKPSDNIDLTSHFCSICQGRPSRCQLYPGIRNPHLVK